jgi:hypothetical protein
MPGSGMRTSRILCESSVFFFYMPYLTNHRLASSVPHARKFKVSKLRCSTRRCTKSSLARLLGSCNHKGEPVGSSRCMIFFGFCLMDGCPVPASMRFHKSIDGQTLKSDRMMLIMSVQWPRSRDSMPPSTEPAVREITFQKDGGVTRSYFCMWQLNCHPIREADRWQGTILGFGATYPWPNNGSERVDDAPYGFASYGIHR